VALRLPAETTSRGAASAPWTAAWCHRPRVRRLILFFVLYVVAAAFAQLLAIIPGTGISIWPPAGLFIATLILSPKGSWSWWVLAGLAAELTGNILWFRNPLPVAVLMYTGNALEAIVGAWLVRRFCNGPLRLETLREVLVLLAFGAGLAPVVSATIGSATLAWFGLQPFARAWPLWWIGDATGVLIVAPLALVLVQDWQGIARLSVARAIEAGVLLLVLLGAAILSLSGYLPFAYIIMPPLLWAAVRFEFKGAAVLLVLLAVMTALFTVSGESQFAGDAGSQKQKHIMMQLFLAISALSALVVAALSRQYQQALQTLRAANNELETRVTERTGSLRDSERRLAAVLDALPIGVALVDLKGAIVVGNEVFKSYVPAVIPARDEARFGLWEGYDPEGRRIERQNYSAMRALRGERVWPGQEFLFHGDPARGPVWTRIAALPFRNEIGQITGATVVIDDIDQERRAQDALRTSELRLRLAQDAAGLGVWDHDFTTGLSSWSEQTRGHLGVGPDEPASLAILLARVHPDDRSIIDAEIARVAHPDAGPQYRTEYRVVLPDGSVRWLESQGRVERGADGTALRAAGVMRDVTDRKQSDLALAENAARLRLALSTAALGIVEWDFDAGTMRLDPDASALTRGLLPAERPLPVNGPERSAWVARIHPDDQNEREARRAALDRNDAVILHGEYRVRLPRPDGQGEAWAWIAYRGGVVTRDPASGRVRRMIDVIQDITERKHAEAALAESEAALRRLNEGLEARVRAEVAAREAAQASLAHMQRMEALGQLAGGIAHDFNNVLQAVQGGASLIERRATEPERIRRLARMVFEAAGRGSSITRRLLAFSRRGDLRAEAVDPVMLLTGMHEILTHTLGGGVNVRLDAPIGLPALFADKGQLETVLVNLATNARDAMAGYGTLTLAASVETTSRDNDPGHPAALKAGTYVRLAVTDTGAGMPPDVLARVTEPFFTTKPQGKGTGLGLAMARGFAEQSGGGLHIESAPGRGTTVTLWFPLAEALPGPMPEQAGSGEKPADIERARLLVVDDDTIVRTFIIEELEAAGYAVVSAGDGPLALALVDSGEPVDLLVSDLSMPGMDGVALVREVQRRRPGLPAILLTGFATNVAEIAVSGAVSGAFSLLRKPVEGKVLAERVAVLLEGVAATSSASRQR